jgi:hypothetical protein
LLGAGRKVSRLQKYSIVSHVISVMRKHRHALPMPTPFLRAAVDADADDGLTLPACQIHQVLWTGRNGGMIYRCQDMAVIYGRSMVQWGLSELGLRLAFTGRPPVKREVPILDCLAKHPGSTSPELSDALGVPASIISQRLRNLETNGMVSRDDNRPAKWAINWIEQ